MQVPGSTTYCLALYYMINFPVERVPLLERFVKGDDAFRNSRFKLIPYISKVWICPLYLTFEFWFVVSWIYRQSTLLISFSFCSISYLFVVLIGLLASEAKCGEKSLLDWSSIGYKLFWREKLLGGKKSYLNNKIFNAVRSLDYAYLLCHFLYMDLGHLDKKVLDFIWSYLK